jgi:hypothetical protein
LAGYATMNAAAIQALDDVAAVTSAVGREFAGSICKQNGAFKFTPPQMGGADCHHPQLRFHAARSGSRSITRILM